MRRASFDLLLGGEQRHLADVLEVHADRVEVAGLASVTARSGLVEHRGNVAAGAGAGRRRLARTRDRRRPGLAAACPVRRSFVAPASVLELELLGDLVLDGDAARLDAPVDVGELVGLGLERVQRGEDLAGGERAPLASRAPPVRRGRVRERLARRGVQAASRPGGSAIEHNPL